MPQQPWPITTIIPHSNKFKLPGSRGEWVGLIGEWVGLGGEDGGRGWKSGSCPTETLRPTTTIEVSVGSKTESHRIPTAFPAVPQRWLYTTLAPHPTQCVRWCWCVWGWSVEPGTPPHPGSLLEWICGWAGHHSDLVCWRRHRTPPGLGVCPEIRCAPRHALVSLLGGPECLGLLRAPVVNWQWWRCPSSSPDVENRKIEDQVTVINAIWIKGKTQLRYVRPAQMLKK